MKADWNALKERVHEYLGDTERPFRLACLGPSGTGKTTMAEFLEKQLEIPFIRNSAGMIIPEETQKRFMEMYGWSKKGHAEVIKLSMITPEFGREYQLAILKARMEIIAKNDRVIMDRSLIDNVSYCIMQVALNSTQEWVEEFKDEAVKFFKGHMTHLLFFHPVARDVENNQSRIANIHYQRAVNAVFQDTYARYFQESAEYMEKLSMNTWDLEAKRDIVYRWLDAWLISEDY